MEVAGLVVGVVPIVVAILKQYVTLQRVCRRIKHHKAGVDDLWRFLKRQKVIFVNETRILLAAVVGPEQASFMVGDTSCPQWSDKAVHLQLNQMLGENKQDLSDAAQEVAAQIQKLMSEIDSCEKSLSSRIKFGFNESRLDKICQTLREYTEDYRTLRKQVHELSTSRPVVESQSTVGADAGYVRATQTAAKQVYEGLVAACKLHTMHHAHISLKPVCSSNGMDPEIKFKIAYRHLSRQQLKGGGNVLWFMVESVISGTIIRNPQKTRASASVSASYTTGGPSGKRPLSPQLKAITEGARIETKRVRFLPTLPSAPLGQIVVSPAQTPPPAGLPDLCVAGDLCRQLLKCCQSRNDSGICVGLLKHSPESKHRVYHTHSPCQQSSTLDQPDAKALAELLASTRQDHAAAAPYMFLSELQRLRLARLLSSAVLNYYSTPWMQRSWRSDDIFLYNSNRILGTGTTSLGSEPEAYVEAPVKQDAADGCDQQRSFDLPVVRNSTLFSLGVLLLELAFGRPLYRMVKPCDAKPGISAAERDYNAAMRLSKQVPTGLGVKYARMVEQCLFCTFGHGTELENPALQDAVNRDVVSELDRLIHGLSSLYI